MTSIVGTWNMRVSWGSGLGAGKVLKAATKTFYADGTWTYRDGGGRWVQVGDHIFWNFTHYPELVYCANTQFASMTGIMGWPHPGGNRGSFYGLRVGVPGSPDTASTSGGAMENAVTGGGVPDDNSDPLPGPVSDSLLGSLS
ncbi:MAG TPA: hypothetical protein VFV69_02975 [Steroidobacteraceae bacterium]|nr:hypothetical protein [Steroidobacteraceae bacterium]